MFVPSTSQQALVSQWKDMLTFTLPPGRTEAQVSLGQDVMPRFDAKITRLPVFVDGDAVKYVIDESTVNKFVLKQLLQAPGGPTHAPRPLER